MHNELDSVELILLKNEVKKRGKDKVIAWLLWLFLGNFGGHNFYLGEKGKGFTKITLSTVGVIAWCISFVLMFVEIADSMTSYTEDNVGVYLLAFIALSLMFLGLAVWCIVEAFFINKKIDEHNEGIEKELVAETLRNRKG